MTAARGRTRASHGPASSASSASAVSGWRPARPAPGRPLSAGADVIVAQGAEAGGHGGRGWSTMAFVPVVADLAAPAPVLAAGGIADGRGLAAALGPSPRSCIMGCGP
jgi:hypothetical protein